MAQYDKPRIPGHITITCAFCLLYIKDLQPGFGFPFGFPCNTPTRAPHPICLFHSSTERGMGERALEKPCPTVSFPESPGSFPKPGPGHSLPIALARRFTSPQQLTQEVGSKVPAQWGTLQLGWFPFTTPETAGTNTKKDRPNWSGPFWGRTERSERAFLAAQAAREEDADARLSPEQKEAVLSLCLVTSRTSKANRRDQPDLCKPKKWQRGVSPWWLGNWFLVLFQMVI